MGQRRGLGVAAGEPLYVISTEPATRRVVIGRDDDLLRAAMIVKDVNWISIAAPAAPMRAEVKIRNKHVRCGRDAHADRWLRASRFVSMSRSGRSRRGKARCSIRANWFSAAAGSSSARVLGGVFCPLDSAARLHYLFPIRWRDSM